MAFDGNGNWISTFSAVADRNAGIKILATRFDNIFINDIAQSFENCLTKDGQVKTQVNFDLNNNRLINVVDPINEYDGANKAYVDYCIAHVEQDPLFAFKWADYEIADQSWLRADTFSWQDGTVYTNAYSHLVADVEDVNTTTEVVAGYTITYYPCADGHKIVTPIQESVVQNIYDATGVAWYYVLDQANQRFKLPRTKYGFTGLRDTVGKYVDAGVPNITGRFGELLCNDASGAFETTGGGWRAYVGNSSMQDFVATFDASRSSSVYGNSTTVQPPATQMYLYFYVGNFTQTATEQTAGLNSELFNGKVDINAANLSDAGNSLVAGLGMPSSIYDNLTLGVDGSTYTAPANGWFTWFKVTTVANQYFGMVNQTSGNLQSITWVPIIGGGCQGYIPARKGDTCAVFYTTSGAPEQFRFIYAKGSESEAS